MGGTAKGGKAASKTNIKKYGPDFYSNIGRKGGSAKRVRQCGFATMPREKLLAVASKGGRQPRRKI